MGEAEASEKAGEEGKVEIPRGTMKRTAEANHIP